MVWYSELKLSKVAVLHSDHALYARSSVVIKPLLKSMNVAIDIVTVPSRRSSNHAYVENVDRLDLVC